MSRTASGDFQAPTTIGVQDQQLIHGREVFDLFGLVGRSALVVGGSGYLGSQMCRAIAALGCSVTVASRSVERCREVESTLPRVAESQSHKATMCDVLNRVSIQEAVQTSLNDSGELDILIVSTWAGAKGGLEQISEEDWLMDLEVCLTGPFRLVQEVAPIMSGSGSIILVSSMYGKVAPDPFLYEQNSQVNPPSYGAAKGGLEQLTRYAASFLGQKGVRVNAIAPGAFPHTSDGLETSFEQRLAQKTVLGRIGQPGDLIGVTAFLASDASSYVTGQSISVDGGWTVR